LFNFLENERGFASPYSGDGLNRYAPVKGRSKTLSTDFIDDLLEVTGGGRARDFETARDHAMILILRSEGIRRTKLLGMVMHTLPADVIRNPVFRLVPLKGARAAGEGRLVVLAPASARALAIYLRARRNHPLADSDWVWLGRLMQPRSRSKQVGVMLVPDMASVAATLRAGYLAHAKLIVTAFSQQARAGRRWDGLIRGEAQHRRTRLLRA
jgi:site-specific recombinase XerD